MNYLFSPIFASLAGVSVTFMLIFSSVYLAGNKPSFQAFFTFSMAIIFVMYLLKKDSNFYLVLKKFWAWSLFLNIIFLIGLWRYVMYQNMISSGISDKQMILWSISEGTVTPINSFFHYMYWIGMYFLFILSVTASHYKKFKIRFILLFFIMTALLSVYGLCIYIAGNQYILWFDKTGYLGDLTATFINRNSFAIFAGCGFLAGVYSLQNKYRKINKTNTSFIIKIFHIGKYLNTSEVLYILGLILIMSAIILTHSRSGITLTILSTIIFYSLTSTVKPHSVIKNYKKYIILFVIFSFIIISPIFLYNYFGRLMYSEKDFIFRLNTYIITLNMILERPFIGFGLGSFEYVFQYYRDSSIHLEGYWDKTHSTFLEIASEIGIPATVFMILGYGYLYFSIVCSYLKNKSRLILLYLLIMAIIVLHSLIDFSLQMPAIAILFHIILGASYNIIKNEP